ncbi:MAG: hypothetical protein IIZ39_15295 [Blautia sp.]|nr:hypothetical protein [Blautia sp.]
MRRFVSRIEELGRRPKNDAFQEDFLALLKDGYEKDLEILCPGITDPADRSMAKQGNVTLDDGSKYLLCVTKMAYGSVFFMSGLSVQDMMIRDVIDRVLDSNVYAGLLFDYKAPTGSFYIKKQDLRRVIRGIPN